MIKMIILQLVNRSFFFLFFMVSYFLHIGRSETRHQQDAARTNIYR